MTDEIMKTKKSKTKPSSTRRSFLKSIVMSAAATAFTVDPSLASVVAPEKQTVRDRLWLFSFATNSDYYHLGRRSVMSAAEGNFYLDVPNIIMVQSSEKEAPWGRFEPPFEPYTVALRPLKKIVWSVTGSGGFHKAEETTEVLSMAKSVHNFRGVMLDDFLITNAKKDKKRAIWTLEELTEVRSKLDQTGKKLDIMATFYVKQFGSPVKDYLELIDILQIWNGKTEEIRDIENNLQKFEQLYPYKRMMLGCYLVDYHRKQGIPVDLMKHQCEVGLRWLQQGRIEGIIFMGNTVMDMGFESVEWTRHWIQQLGGTKLKK